MSGDDDTDAPTEAHPFGDFFHLLRCAQSAAERVHSYDLRDSAESKLEWRCRRIEQAAECRALIRFCAEHRDQLIAAFREDKK